MRRAGFTLVEVLLALGLFSVLMLALVRLLDTSFTIWGQTEENRELVELGSDVLELITRDLRAVEHGPGGDLVCAWIPQDLDRDGLTGAVVPRLALVRSRGAAEAERARGWGAGAAETARDPRVPERIEVLWFFEEPRDAERPPTLLRAARLRGDEETDSLLPVASAAGGGLEAALGLAEEVTDGCLWLSFWFASPTSVLKEGWFLGDELPDCGASWDAWALARPDPEGSGFNEPAPGTVGPTTLPLLPRRVRIELEIERPADLRRRTRLHAALEPEETRLRVRDGRRLPRPGALIRIDDEWLELVATHGDEATVHRGRRGTAPRAHAAGALLHHGRRLVKEVPLRGSREEWIR